MSLTTNKSQISQFKYFCLNCNYNTNNKFDYTKHLTTDKHKKLNLATNSNNSQIKNENNAIDDAQFAGLQIFFILNFY